MPLLRSLPEQPVMRDLYKSQPASCKPLGQLKVTTFFAEVRSGDCGRLAGPQAAGFRNDKEPAKGTLSN